MASSVLQCLLTLACVVLATSQSYRSIKSVLLNHVSAHKLPEKCLPICEDSNGNILNGTHIRDPSSCDQYWICLPDGTLYDQPHVCPVDEIVNINELVCEPIINDGSDQCTIPDPDCDPSISKVCYHEDTCPPLDDVIFSYADEADCSIYHVCHFGDADIECKAPNLYFNGQECVADPTQCCKCQALCKTTWTSIPDPMDKECQSYYLCQGLDTSTSGCMTSMECVSAGYFPRCSNVCDAGFFHCSESSVTEKVTIEPQFCMNGQVFEPTTSRCVPSTYCHSVGYIALEEEKFTCPEGEKYDVSTSQCSASADCDPSCASTSVSPSPLSTSSSSPSPSLSPTSPTATFL